MREISLADYEGLRNVVDNAEAGAAKAALFGTAEEVQKQKRIGAKATAKLVARYSPFELLSRLDNIARHYEARSELYTSDADLAAAMYQLATGPASAQAAENTEERGNG